MRERSFGQGERPTIVDRFGVWLSASAIRRWVPRFDGLRIGDFGCGYDAPFVRSVLAVVKEAVVVDVALAPDLESDSKVTALEGDLLEQLPAIGSETPDGTCLINVPSWRGKRFLEFSAFRLGLSPAAEMKFGLNTFAVCRA